jgi:uncharacterized phage-associated protein
MTKTIIIEALADWFLAKETMTHKKLQKLCYYSVAWGWAVMNRDIAQNGQFQAWVHGPVSPTLYKKYRDKGWNDIQKASKPTVPSDTEELLEAVWVTYGSKSGNELEALSHSETPWVKARAGLPKDEICTNQISNKDMREYYLSIKSTEY